MVGTQTPPDLVLAIEVNMGTLCHTAVSGHLVCALPPLQVNCVQSLRFSSLAGEGRLLSVSVVNNNRSSRYVSCPVVSDFFHGLIQWRTGYSSCNSMVVKQITTKLLPWKTGHTVRV